MPESLPTRDEALALVREFNANESLVKHALAVEAVMRHMARRAGADERLWGLAGLVHDLDYERYPDEHCAKTVEILRERGWPEVIVRAAASHGWGICTDVEPVSEMERTLYAVDELTGLVVATALVRPSKSLHDLKTKSVMKKWKDKAFAAGVDRELVAKGAERLGMDVRDLVTEAIAGMREAADALGLAGEAGSDSGAAG